MSFKSYLQNQNLSPKTIKRLLSWQRQFIAHYPINTNFKALKTIDLLSYIQSKQQQGLKRTTILHDLSRIAHYYSYLEVDNPLENFKLKNHQETDLAKLLKQEELSKIYEVYQQNNRLSLESKIIIGLLVYQGLSSHELPLLLSKSIDLKAAQIHVPPSHLAERSIALQAVQIIDLVHYLEQHKSGKLLAYKNSSHLSNRHVHWTLQVKKELKKHQLTIPFENFRQLRSSRISHWINSKGLLTAQYLAGHQSLAATSRYQRANHQKLRAALEQLHPLF